MRDRDPAQFFYRGQPQRIEQEGDDIVLVLDLPFMEQEAVDLHQRGDELDIQVGWHKHHVMLPDMLARRTAIGARMHEGALRIRFVGGENQTRIVDVRCRFSRQWFQWLVHTSVYVVTDLTKRCAEMRTNVHCQYVRSR